MIGSTHSLRRHARAAAKSLITLVVAGVALQTAASAQGGRDAVYTATNDSTGNSVIAFDRMPSGALSLRGTFATGGLGTGAGLGNQGGLVLDQSGQHLFVVNAGDDSVSTFRIGRKGLTLLDIESSGGTQPISVTVHNDLVYVLNAGGDGNISGLKIERDGTLTPLAGTSRPLSGPAPGPAQISFSRDGHNLIVSEKGTNNLTTYYVGPDGHTSAPIVTPSQGMTPFGFAVGQRGRVFVSEAAGGAAGMSSVSSYAFDADGSLRAITSALPTTQSAACWLVMTPNGRFGYVTNTASDTLTGLRANHDGSLQLESRDGITADSGDGPLDMALSREGHFLYVLNANDNNISAFRIFSDGSLDHLADTPTLPMTINGLVAR